MAAIVEFLTINGIEATHWTSVGASQAPDLEIMAFAKARNYIAMTHDLDFSGIIASTHGLKPIVVQIRSEDVSPAKIGKQIVRALAQMRTELECGALVTIDTIRSRMRLLPLMGRKSSDA